MSEMMKELLVEYLGDTVSENEIKEIALFALTERIRELKLNIGRLVLAAKSANKLDNFDQSNKALHQARDTSREYHELLAEWKRLGGDEELVKSLSSNGSKNDAS